VTPSHFPPLPSPENIDQMGGGKPTTITGATMERGIFEGLKVLDCASFIAAPAQPRCCRISAPT